MIERFYWLVVGLLMAGSLWGQAGVDGLFETPAADIVAQPPAAAKTDLAALNTAPLSIAGHVNINSGALLGLDPTGFFNFGSDFTIEARPDPAIRFHSLILSPVTNLSVPTPTIGELYVDYTLLNTVVFRMGKYSLSWAQGRLFSPGDLMSDSPNGVTLKLFVPVLGQSFTGVLLGNPGVMVNPAVPTFREMAYAGQLSGDAGPVGWGVAALDRPGTVIATPERYGSAFVKSSLFGVDLFAQGLVLASSFQVVSTDVHYVAGFFWEGGDPKGQIQGELTDTRLGAATKIVGWALTPALRWEQSRLDGSGTVIVGMTWAALPHLTVDFGVPWLYGADTSEYLLNDADPHKQRLSVGLRVTLDTTF